MGGSCVNLTNYSGSKDKFGVEVGSWAVAKSPGVAECKLCPGTLLSFNKGKANLIQHSETKKHRSAQTNTGNQGQPDIRDALREKGNDVEVERKARASDFEIALVQSCARHDVPARVVECIIDVVKEHITDSEIMKEVKLCRTKVLYLAEHGLGEYYEKETLKKLRDCDAFSVAFDESEINKKSEMAMTVKIARVRSGGKVL